MVGRTAYIRSLKKEKLEELMCKFQIKFSDSDTLDTLRRVCAKFVKDQNIDLKDFPMLDDADPLPFQQSPSPNILEQPSDPFIALSVPAPASTTAGCVPKIGVSTTATPSGSKEWSDVMCNVLQAVSQLQTLQLSAAQPPPPPISSLSNNIHKITEFRKHCLRVRLRFDGERTGQACSFIEKLKSLKLQHDITDTEVFDVIPELMTGDAEIWYKAFEAEFHDFHHFCQTLFESFLPSDFQKKLIEEIRGRTQGPSEGIDIYVAKMKASNQKLSQPLTDSQLIDIILSNVHPKYLHSLNNLINKTFDEILRAGRQVETISKLSECYKPPKSISALDPTLNCTSKSKSDPVVNSVKTVSEEKSSCSCSCAVSSLTRTTIRCYNCQQSGHVFRDCPEKRKIFCYRCGAPGRTAARCGCSNQPQVSQSLLKRNDEPGKLDKTPEN